MISKDSLFKSLEGLPDKFSLDELLDRVFLLQKIEVGLQQSAEGKTISTNEAKERLKKWLN
jgi:hypothetical protein